MHCAPLIFSSSLAGQKLEAGSNLGPRILCRRIISSLVPAPSLLLLIHCEVDLGFIRQQLDCSVDGVNSFLYIRRKFWFLVPADGRTLALCPAHDSLHLQSRDSGRHAEHQHEWSCQEMNAIICIGALQSQKSRQASKPAGPCRPVCPRWKCRSWTV